jgi:hypothetical protein
MGGEQKEVAFMRTLLLAIASLAIAAPAPAAAQSGPGMQFSARSGSGHHGGFGRHDRRRDDTRRDGRRDGRRDRGNGDVVYYDDYREYQGDSVWKSDSFNDWWHDRPDRAYPRWVATNQNCERKWFAGDTLRC